MRFGYKDKAITTLNIKAIGKSWVHPIDNLNYIDRDYHIYTFDFHTGGWKYTVNSVEFEGLLHERKIEPGNSFAETYAVLLGMLHDYYSFDCEFCSKTKSFVITY